MTVSERNVKFNVFDCPRYLMKNMDWLDEELGGYEDDYLIIDCPGVFPLVLICNPAKGIDTRADRVVHTPPVFTVAGQALRSAGSPRMRALPA